MKARIAAAAPRTSRSPSRADPAPAEGEDRRRRSAVMDAMAFDRRHPDAARVTIDTTGVQPARRGRPPRQMSSREAASFAARFPGAAEVGIL